MMKKGQKETRPLRKIIGHARLALTGTFTAIYEVYECGHIRLPKMDIYGETNASRRRCYKCSLGKPTDIRTDDERIN